MNEEDLSDIMAKITNMMNNSNSNVSDNIDNSGKVTENNSGDNNFNIDFETMLKMKKVIDKINNNQNSPRTNLLLSLKPYLKPSRKDKLDQYIKLLNMENMLEIFKQEDNNGGDNKC